MIPLAFAWLAGAAFAASLLFFLYSYLVTFGVVPVSGGAWLGPVAADVALFSAFALHHSLFARTPLKTAVGAWVGHTLERAFYTMVASVLFVAVCWYWQPVPGMLYALDGAWRVVAYASLAIGLLLTAAGARALDVLELAGVRQVMNSSARAAHRPLPVRRALKIDGVYGIVRHPLYFGWIFIVAGVPAMTMTRLVFAVISTIYLAVAIPYEERSLIETFGPDYASYQRKVRWRMIPGLY